jgi:uncharacterized delta-60 repeat protein
MKSTFIAFSILLFGFKLFSQAGIPDSDFDADGIRLIDIGDSSSVARAVTVQPDNKIIAVGYAYKGTDRDMVLVRLNPDGSLDTDFGEGGIVFADFGEGDLASALALQPDGKIIVVGTTFSGNSFAIARFLSDGTPDNDFSEDGMDVSGIGDQADGGPAVLLQSDGKIIIAGTDYNVPDYYFAMIRYNSDGSVDDTFIPGNDVVEGLANNAVLLNDGKILMVGQNNGGTGVDFQTARFNNDGTLDNTFSYDGKVNTDISYTDVAFDVNVLPDDKFIVAGYTYTVADFRFAFVRYNEDGTLDNTFGTNGISYEDLTDISGTEYCRGIYVQPDQKILAAGYLYNSAPYTLLARMNSNGSVDSTFGDNGKFIAVEIGGAYDVTMQHDGKILLAGYAGEDFNTKFTVMRLTNDVAVGINTQNHEQQIHISPNPFYDHVEITRQPENDLHLSIYSVLGNLVYTTPVANESEQISLDFLDPGMYIFKINGTGKSYSELMIKQ